MKSTRSLLIHLPALAVLLLGGLTGCSGLDEWAANRPPVYEPSGVVTMKGAPVEGATVIYHSQDHELSAQGLTDKDGRFTLTTLDQDDGAVAGMHKVVITKRVYKEVKTKYDSPEEASVASIPTDVLSLKLASPATTPLEATVSSSGGNEASFEVTPK